MGSLYEIITVYIITSWGRFDGHVDVNLPMYGRYNDTDIIRYTYWRKDGNKGGDATETNDWNHFYYPRHYPYKNIPTSEKIHSLAYYWDGAYADKIWALDYMRL